MQGRITGFFMTLFMVLPLAAIPLMSIFGVPQLGSLASTIENSGFLLEESADRSGQKAEFWDLDSAPTFEESSSGFEQAGLNSAVPRHGQAFQTAEQNLNSNAKSATQQDAARTWEQSLQQLTHFGIRQYRLQPGLQPNSFHFTCFSPSGTVAGTTTIIRFEAEASNPQAALQLVLEQVQNWYELSQPTASQSLL